MVGRPKEILGYQGDDFVEEEAEVIVCPNPKCRHKHVDESGDTNIISEGVTKGDKFTYFTCYECDTIMWAQDANAPRDEEGYGPCEVPFWILKKYKVRKQAVNQH